MLGDLMGKMKEAQRLVEETKQRLNNITVIGESNGGAVKVIMNGNRVVKDININDDLININNKEELIDLIVLATNKALDSAENVNNSEMQSATAGLMPGLF